MKKIISFTLFSTFLAGCVTPFSQTYYDNTGGADITTDPSVILSHEEPKLFRGTDEEEDSLRMLENGFVLLGYSAFDGGNADENGTIVQAKKVHASVVMLYSRNTVTVSSAVPVTLPDTQTSTTMLAASAYGSGGDATYSGTANITNYASRTTFIPYIFHRADYLATYWVKIKPPRLGVQITDLTSEIQQEIKSDKGMLITAVVRDSPAFNADILRGDVLKKIGNVEIYDSEITHQAVQQYSGQKVPVFLIRDRKEITKEVQLRTED